VTQPLQQRPSGAKIAAMTTPSRPFPRFEHPIVLAPMAGGPSTPALAAAVCNAGGFGFLAAGMKTVEAVRAELELTRAQTRQAFGLNLLMPGPNAADPALVRRYSDALRGEAARYGVELGAPRHDDDLFAGKLALAIEARVPVVSFAFACPARAVFEQLHAAGLAAWVTVTELDEALAAEQAGADALIVQGVEAGGHRGSFEDQDGRGELGLLSLLRLVARRTNLPLVAAGGIADGEAVAAALAAGATAAQVGSAFMRCPEAGTSIAHRSALAAGGTTGLTRAFSGRRARGLVNRFQAEYSSIAPAAYPEIVHVIAPLRAAASAAGDSQAINLWAGQAHALAEERPAGELVGQWSSDATRALQRTLTRLQAR
jgi:nitronate monooxygenase